MTCIPNPFIWQPKSGLIQHEHRSGLVPVVMVSLGLYLALINLYIFVYGIGVGVTTVTKIFVL